MYTRYLPLTFVMALLLPITNRAMEKDNPTNLLVNGIQESNPEYVMQAIKKNVDTNALIKNGDTPLTLAVQQVPSKKAEKIVSILIKHKADINRPDTFGWTPLMWASRHGRRTFIKELLRSKELDLNKTALKDKKTALMIAAEKGHLDVVKLLVDKGAQITLQDAQGKTAIDLAQDKIISTQNKKVKNYLKETLDKQNIKKQGVWSRITGSASKTVIDTKPEAAVFVWARDHSGKERTANINLSELQKSINKYPGDKKDLIDFQGPYNYSALHYAVVNGDVPLAQLLLKNGAFPLIRDANGQTQLYQVLYHATATNKEKTKMLLTLFRKACEKIGESYNTALQEAYQLLPRAQKTALKLPSDEIQIVNPL